MKTFTTKIYNQPNPIGFDYEVYLIQLQLQKLPWLEACFGVAHTQKRTLSENEASTKQLEGYRGTMKYETWYPQGFKNEIGDTGSLIDQDLTFDDSYASRIFFSIAGEAGTNPKENDWNPINLDIQIVQKFSLILHANLTALEIPSTEQLKLDLLWIVGQITKLTGFYLCENINDVWKEYTLTPEIQGCTRYPNYCLRIDMTCNYPAFPTNGQNLYQPNY